MGCFRLCFGLACNLLSPVPIGLDSNTFCYPSVFHSTLESFSLNLVDRKIPIFIAKNLDLVYFFQLAHILDLYYICGTVLTLRRPELRYGPVVCEASVLLLLRCRCICYDSYYSIIL